MFNLLKTSAILASLISVTAFGVIPPESKNWTTATTSVDLPKSREPAKDEPKCGDVRQWTAADIAASIPQVVADALIGAPLILGSNFSSGGSISNMFKSIFGSHDGPAACAVMCVTIPMERTVKWADACAKDDKGRICEEGTGDIPMNYWAAVRGRTETISANRKLVCATAKSWAHDRNRTISWRIWY